MWSNFLTRSWASFPSRYLARWFLTQLDNSGSSRDSRGTRQWPFCRLYRTRRKYISCQWWLNFSKWALDHVKPSSSNCCRCSSEKCAGGRRRRASTHLARVGKSLDWRGTLTVPWFLWYACRAIILAVHFAPASVDLILACICEEDIEWCCTWRNVARWDWILTLNPGRSMTVRRWEMRW